MALSMGAQIGVNAASSAVQAGFNRAAANHAWDRQKDAWTKGPGYARAGLEAAGFNPLLASGIGSAVMGARGVSQAPVSQGQVDVAKLSKLSPEKKLIEKQTDAARANAAAGDASARSSDAAAAKIRTENDIALTKLPAALNEQAVDQSPMGMQAIARARMNQLAAAAAPTVESVLGTTTLGLEKGVEKLIDAISEKLQTNKNPANLVVTPK